MECNKISTKHKQMFQIFSVMGKYSNLYILISLISNFGKTYVLIQVSAEPPLLLDTGIVWVMFTERIMSEWYVFSYFNFSLYLPTFSISGKKSLKMMERLCGKEIKEGGEQGWRTQSSVSAGRPASGVRRGSRAVKKPSLQDVQAGCMRSDG